MMEADHDALGRIYGDKRIAFSSIYVLDLRLLIKVGTQYQPTLMLDQTQ